VEIKMFGHKKGEKMKEVSVEYVRKLAAAGKSEEEITKQLLSEGYEKEAIERALNQALKFEISGAPAEAPTGAPLPPPPKPTERPPEKPPEAVPEFIAPPPEATLKEISKEEAVEMPEEEEIALEDLVDEIVDARVSELETKLRELSAADAKLREELQSIKQKIEEIRSIGVGEKTELKGRVEETEGRIENIESRISSLEKAFKEFLPTLTENVRTLSEVVDKLKLRGKAEKKGK
jgi:chaperonin cofactor prefoldin